MVKTSPAQKKPVVKAAAVPKKTNATSKATVKQSASRKRLAAKKQVANTPQKVDYYPNRMTLAVSALAGTLIVLIALIAVLGH